MRPFSADWRSRFTRDPGDADEGGLQAGIAAAAKLARHCVCSALDLNRKPGLKESMAAEVLVPMKFPAPPSSHGAMPGDKGDERTAPSAVAEVASLVCPEGADTAASS